MGPSLYRSFSVIRLMLYKELNHHFHIFPTEHASKQTTDNVRSFRHLEKGIKKSPLIKIVPNILSDSYCENSIQHLSGKGKKAVKKKAWGYFSINMFKISGEY